MKEQLEKLIELAKDYVIFGIEIGLPDTHNHIRGGHQGNHEWRQEGKLINVYFANNGTTWQVQFDKVTIVGYSKNIEIPWDATTESLDVVYEDVRSYLYDYLLPNVAKCKLVTLKERHIKIKELERELRKLKGLI